MVARRTADRFRAGIGRGRSDLHGAFRGRSRAAADPDVGPAYFLGEFIPALTWSPDGKWLAFSQKGSEDGPVRVVVMSMETQETRPFTFPPSGSPGDFWPEFSPDGESIAFVRKTARGHERRVDSARLAQRGQSADLQELPVLRRTGLDCRRPGHCVFGGCGRSFSKNLAGLGRRGRPGTVPGSGSECGPAVDLEKPDRVCAGSGRRDQHLAPAGTEGSRFRPATRLRLIASSGDDTNPRFSPDGMRIAFESTRSGTNQIWTCAGDGSGQVQLTNFGGYSGAASWSPDGARIAFDSTASGNREIWIVDSRGGAPGQLTKSAAQDSTPSFSRDGRWIYFSSDRSGKFQIWKVPAEGGSAVQVTRGGGFYAVESHDASSIYYSQRNRSGIWKVPIGGGEEIRILSRPVNWTDWSLSREGISPGPETPACRRRIRHRLPGDSVPEEITEIYQAESPCLHGWLAVSPDERWILYGEVPRWEVNLMLAENLPLRNPVSLRFPALLLGIHPPR